MPHVALSPHAQVPTPSGAVGVSHPGNENLLHRNRLDRRVSAGMGMEATEAYSGHPGRA